MMFELNSQLTSKLFIMDFPLCRILMENERHYPWLLLVPRRLHVSRIMDLSSEDQLQLLKELDFVQKVLWDAFQPTQLNVAAIGNKTPQLHIHVIARYQSDPAWPHTVWDHPVRDFYEENQKDAFIHKMRSILSLFQKKDQSNQSIS